jgi:hypothetical protein
MTHVSYCITIWLKSGTLLVKFPWPQAMNEVLHSLIQTFHFQDRIWEYIPLLGLHCTKPMEHACRPPGTAFHFLARFWSCKTQLLNPSCLLWNNLAPTEVPIFVKIRRNIGHFTWRPKYILYCWKSHVAQWNKREITVSFPWQHLYLVLLHILFKQNGLTNMPVKESKDSNMPCYVIHTMPLFISVLISILALLSKLKYGHQLHSRRGYKTPCWWMIKITMGQTTFSPSFITYYSKSKHYCTLYWSVKHTMYKQKNWIKKTLFCHKHENVTLTLTLTIN